MPSWNSSKSPNLLPMLPSREGCKGAMQCEGSMSNGDLFYDSVSMEQFKLGSVSFVGCKML